MTQITVEYVAQRCAEKLRSIGHTSKHITPLVDFTPDMLGAPDDREWFGVNLVDAGFESESAMLVIDRYGGGCAHVLFVNPDDDQDDVVNSLATMMVDVMNASEEYDWDITRFSTLIFVF